MQYPIYPATPPCSAERLLDGKLDVTLLYWSDISLQYNRVLGHNGE